MRKVIKTTFFKYPKPIHVHTKPNFPSKFSPSSKLLCATKLPYLKTYAHFVNKKTETLIDFYKKNNAHSSILPLVSLDNKLFGSILEDIVRERLGLDKSPHSSYDACFKDMKFEIKASRYWRTLEDFKWQHIMKDHPYDMLLLVGIEFQEIKIYMMHKKIFLDLVQRNIVKQQGGAEGQGYWMTRKQVLKYLVELRNHQDFVTQLNKWTLPPTTPPTTDNNNSKKK
jgi:hypothetical protein